MTRTRLLGGCCLALAITAGAGCADPSGEDPATPQPHAAALERARGSAQALGTELMGTLTSELGRGGAVAAVRVCSDTAQDLTRAHSRDGLTIRRVSLRARNPANTPDPWERQKLQELARRHTAGELPAELVEVVEHGGARRLRYLRPIVVGPPCLACHGDARALDEDVRELLDERYPDDPARGYRAGDFRGAISVTVEL